MLSLNDAATGVVGDQLATVQPEVIVPRIVDVIAEATPFVPVSVRIDSPVTPLCADGWPTLTQVVEEQFPVRIHVTRPLQAEQLQRIPAGS